MAKTLPRVSWEGMPLSSSNILRNHPSLRLPNASHVYPSVRARYDTAERNGQDVDQIVSLGAIYTRVYQAAEVFRQGRCVTSCHGSLSI